MDDRITPRPGTNPVSVYRTGAHWGVTIVREGTGQPDDTGRRSGDELVAVVVNGDKALAERICALLNADTTGPSTPAQEALE